MRVGTKSLLFGVHAFWFHPLTVALAWRKMYNRWPHGLEWLCIVVHDWGLWGSPNMDGPEGEDHPRRSANILIAIVGERYRWRYEYWLVKFHSRHLAREYHTAPSTLCWPDKLSIVYDPEWFYLLRAHLSGEIAEYREMSSTNQWNVGLDKSDHEWFLVARANSIKLSITMDPASVGYQHQRK